MGWIAGIRAMRCGCRLRVAPWVVSHPLFVAAVVAVVCLAFGQWNLACGLGLAGVAWILGSWAVGWRTGCGWGLCALWVCGWTAWQQARDDRWAGELCVLPPKEVSGVLLEDARGSSSHWSAPVALASDHRSAKVWWQGRGGMPPAGALVSAYGAFHPLEGPRNPGEFDRAAWLRRLGIVADFRQSAREASIDVGTGARVGFAVRQWFRDQVVVGLDPQGEAAQVIRAVVLGERPGAQGEAIIDAFRDSGNLHVFSVSGLHVAMVGAILWWVLGWLGLPRRWAVGVLVVSIFAYAWMTGGSPPAMRSAWMAALFLGAFVVRRKPDLLNALGGVLLVGILWDGRLVFQPGVQLSYGVVAVMGLIGHRAIGWFGFLAREEAYLPVRQLTRWQSAWLGFRRWLAQSLGVSVAAALGSAPLSVYHFGLWAPVSVLGALVILPLVFLLLVLGLAAVAVSCLCLPVQVGINRINGALASGCVRSAEWLAAIPGGHWNTRGIGDTGLLVYDLAHGDGAACFFPGGGDPVMIDCGGRWSFERQVRPSLQQLGLRPGMVVLTHPDGGHLGGGEAVWKSLPIRQVVLPVAQARSVAYQAWVEQAPQAGVVLHQAVVGERLPLAREVWLDVLHTSGRNEQQAMADQRVAVYRIDWSGWRFLFTSDAGMGAERAMLASGIGLAADVIIAGKNRVDVSLTDEFLDAVRPKVIVIHNDAYAANERWLPETLEYWRSRGIRVVDQAASGGIILRVDCHGDLTGQSMLEPLPWVVSRR